MKSRKRGRGRVRGVRRQPAVGRRTKKVQGVRVPGRGKASGGRKSPPASISKKRRVGRPSIFLDAGTSARKKILGRITSYAALGFIDSEIAEMLGVSLSTFKNWKDDPEFLATLKNGKNKADALVIRALYNRAVGLKTKPADVTACIFWLKNRQPDRWRDKHDATIVGPPETGGRIIVEVVQVKSRERGGGDDELTTAAAAGAELTDAELEAEVRRLETKKARLIAARKTEGKTAELERRAERVHQVKRATRDAEDRTRRKI